MRIKIDVLENPQQRRPDESWRPLVPVEPESGMLATPTMTTIAKRRQAAAGGEGMPFTMRHFLEQARATIARLRRSPHV